MAIELNIPPETLKKKLEITPPNIAPIKLRSTTSIRVSLYPNMTMVIIVIMLAKPNFTPGAGMGMGIKLSTKCNTKA